MEFQSVRGFEEEDAIREALKRFLVAILAEWYFVRGSAKEFEVMR